VSLHLLVVVNLRLFDSCLRRPPRSTLCFGDRLRSVEHDSNLFKRMAFGLREKDESDGEEERQQDTEHDIVVPSNVVQSNRVHKGEDNEGSVYCQMVDG
jgi:hypothetical protein